LTAEHAAEAEEIREEPRRGSDEELRKIALPLASQSNSQLFF